MADHHYYSDIEDVRARLMGDVSTDDVSADDLERGAKDVHTLINAKLGKLHTVPFPLSGETPDTPAIIRGISDILTACWGNSHTIGLNVRSRGPGADECQRARDMIDELAAGDLTIPGYTTSALPSSNTDGEHSIFDKVGIHEMGQDADQADRLSDERD